MYRIRLAVAIVVLVSLTLLPSPAASGRPNAVAPALRPALRMSKTSSELRKEVRRKVHGWKLSQGARAWLRTERLRDQLQGGPGILASQISFGSNVDANDPAQDLASDQSETAIGATSNGRVLAAWNDISGIMWRDSTDVRGSLTGVGYSDDGAQTFTDLIGLPNPTANQQASGDPTIVAIDDDHFVVGSLYFPSSTARCRNGAVYLTAALWVGTVTGGTVSFSDPIVAVRSGDLCARRRRAHAPSLIDKEFLSYDPTSRTLAMSYTRFLFAGSGLGQIEVRRAIVPADPALLSLADFTKPVVVWAEEDYCDESSEAAQCGSVNQGAYPAVAPNGDVYVAWERNIFTNVFSSDPFVYIHAAWVPTADTAPAAGGRDAPVVLTEGQVNGHPDGGVRSLDTVFISGYSRGAGNDLPRVAFDPTSNEPVFVWNDANLHPLGDIWLRTASADLFTMNPIQRVNDDDSFALHFLPAVSVGSDGSIRTSWYDRRTKGADSSKTEYWAEVRSDASNDATDFVVTTGSTDWVGTSTLFFPNFGDYTDNVTVGTTTYFTWSDGRIGVPQPFVDSVTVP